MVIIICVLFSFKMGLCRFYSFFGLSFKLIRNSSSIMLNLVKCMMVCILWIKFSFYGLIVIFVSK